MMMITLTALKAVFRWTAYILLAVFFVFLVSTIAETYIMPKLSASPFFSKFPIFQRASENITIIENRTDQIVINENDRLAQIAQGAENAIVRIVSTSPQTGQILQGDGAFITSDGIIATNIESILATIPSTQYFVETFDGSIHEAQLQSIDQFRNLAFLRVENGTFHSIEYASADQLVPGRKILILGASPAPNEISVNTGLISEFDPFFNIANSAISSTEKLEGIYRISPESPSAARVGDTVITYDGRLAGIVGMRTVDGNSELYLLSSEIIQQSIQRANENRQELDAAFGAFYTPLSPILSEIYDLPVKEGAWMAFPGSSTGIVTLSQSIAQQIGLRYGDIITSVNGQNISPNQPLSNTLHQILQNTDENLTMTMLRNENELTLTFER